MKARLFVCLSVALCAACGNEQGVGSRYRAERALWHLNREYRRLSIKPELVESETWRNLAQGYETLAQGTDTSASSAGDPLAQDIHTLVARALVNAAQIHAGIGDSTAMRANYGRVIAEFQDVPLLVGEVKLAQGRMHEYAKLWVEAAKAYETILEHIEPQPGEPGVPGLVIEIPLRVARLHRQASMDAAPGDTSAVRSAPVQAAYEQAEEHYRRWITAKPESRLALESRLRLADVAADCGRWQVAMGELRQIEAQIAADRSSTLDPGNVRLSMAMVQSRASAAPGPTRDLLLSVPRDYPKSPAAAQALLTLATLDARQGAVDEALDALDRLRDEYAGASSLNANGMLLRGRLLEREGRWPEALDVFRSLPVRHPLSDPALLAPLEVVAHYKRVEDATETAAALERAEREYRELLTRYPSHQTTLPIRTKLAQVLAMQHRNEEALVELMGIADALPGNPQGASIMLQAAKFAYNDMGDRKRAAEILGNLAQRYPNMEVGRWAAAEAVRLREVSSE